MCHLKAKNLLLVSGKLQILHRRKLGKASEKKYGIIWEFFFFEYLSKMCHLKPKNLLLVSGKPQILHRRKLCRA